ncbi:MAG: putative monovalent cation/H+ antiporter subunit A [Saprospirales bacterium]|nr:MAG: putative monovalent cation/H+ antiporter subunit A [Saprospirales bacterium]
MLTIVLTGVVFAFFVPAIYRIFKGNTGMVLALYPAAVFAWLMTQFGSVSGGDVVSSSWDWVPTMGISLSFHLDGLSMLFALLITGIGTLVLAYAGTYMKGMPKTDRFFMALVLFMASMLGLVLSDNIISLFIFWELTSFSSYFLIGYHHEDKESRKSALEALLITAGGGLGLLAGLILLGIGGGSMEMSELVERGDQLAESGLFTGAMLLIIIGCFTKSAQFPFHFWLPSAMAAPTPVSAYLHSATMVKAGVYLLARVSPVFNGADGWHALLLIFGGITMVLGAMIAVMQTDLKKILAYTTVSALGLLVMLLGIGTGIAIKAAVIFILAHALYKGCLFLVAGILDHETGSRNIRKLGRLFKQMPVTGTAAVVACLSMAGIPPLFGFISKEYSYESTIGMVINSPLTTSAFFITGMLFVAAAGMLSYMVFFGRRNKLDIKPHEAPITMLVGPAVLAVLSIVLGVFSGLINPLLDQASQVVFPGNEPLNLKLWHGINTELILSMTTLVAGIAAFAFVYYNPRLMSMIEISDKIKPSYAYKQTMDSLAELAKNVTQKVQNGYLRVYISMMVGTFCVLALIVLKDFGIPNIEVLWSDFRVYDIVIGVLMIVACFYTVVAKSRLLAIAMLGVVGYGVAFVFIIFGAPDLAMTQILIETLTVVLFVLVLWKLPHYLIFDEGFIKFRYFLVSALFGAIMTWIVMLITSHPLDSHLKTWFAESSYPLGMGRNVVNVILVDFRSLDTLGEIVVLGIAAVGIYGLIKFTTEDDKEEAI